MSTQKKLTPKEIKEHFFASYVLVVILDSHLHDDALRERAIDLIASKHHAKCIELGLSTQAAADALLEACRWVTERGWSLQMVSAEAGDAPDYHIKFVDELHSDPDFLAIAELARRPSNQ